MQLFRQHGTAINIRQLILVVTAQLTTELPTRYIYQSANPLTKLPTRYIYQSANSLQNCQQLFVPDKLQIFHLPINPATCRSSQLSVEPKKHNRATAEPKAPKAHRATAEPKAHAGPPQSHGSHDQAASWSSSSASSRCFNSRFNSLARLSWNSSSLAKAESKWRFLQNQHQNSWPDHVARLMLGRRDDLVFQNLLDSKAVKGYI